MLCNLDLWIKCSRLRANHVSKTKVKGIILCTKLLQRAGVRSNPRWVASSHSPLMMHGSSSLESWHLSPCWLSSDNRLMQTGGQASSRLLFIYNNLIRFIAITTMITSNITSSTIFLQHILNCMPS